MKKKRNYNEKSRQNLITLAERSEEEKAAIRAKGTEARKRNALHRKAVKEVADAILQLQGNDLTTCIDNQALKDKAESLNLTIYDVMMLKMVDQSLKGSTKAFETVRDSAGDKPISKTESNVNIISENDNALLHRIADRLGINTEQVIEADYIDL